MTDPLPSLPNQDPSALNPLMVSKPFLTFQPSVQGHAIAGSLRGGFAGFELVLPALHLSLGKSRSLDFGSLFRWGSFFSSQNGEKIPLQASEKKAGVESAYTHPTHALEFGPRASFNYWENKYFSAGVHGDLTFLVINQNTAYFPSEKINPSLLPQDDGAPAYSFGLGVSALHYLNFQIHPRFFFQASAGAQGHFLLSGLKENKFGFLGALGFGARL